MMIPARTNTSTPSTDACSGTHAGTGAAGLTPDQPLFFDKDSFLNFLNPLIDPIIRGLREIGSGG